MKQLILVFALAFWGSAHALMVTSDSIGGSYTTAEAINFDGDFSSARTTASSSTSSSTATASTVMGEKGVWYAGLTLSRSKVPDPTNDTYDRTTEIIVGGGIEKKDDYKYGGGLLFSSTPEESLKQYGPNIYLGKTFKISQGQGQHGQEQNQNQEKGFTPSLSGKITLTDLIYVQTFSTTINLFKPHPVTGESGINQFSTSLEATFDYIEPLSFKLGYTHYSYNRSVNDFLATLNSARAVAIGLSGLTNAVQGFLSDLVTLDLYWYPIENWEFDEDASVSRSASDNSYGWNVKETALYDLSTHWKAGLAYEYESSSTLTDHVYTLTIKYSND